MVGLDRARSAPCSPSRSPYVAGTGRKELRAAPDGRVDAAMQARHQRRRHAPEHAWLKFRQQFDRGAPALDLLVSRDVSAHGARLGICTRGGKAVSTTPVRVKKLDRGRVFRSLTETPAQSMLWANSGAM